MISKFLNIDKDNFLYSIIIFSLLAIAFCSLTSCEPKPKKDLKEIKSDTGTYTVTVIDGCEYLTYGYVGGTIPHVITHKGNCKNPIHQRTTN